MLFLYFTYNYNSYLLTDIILAYKHSQKYRSGRPKPWLVDDKRRKKKAAFTLEFSKSYDDSVSTSQDDWVKKDKDPDTMSHRSERVTFKTTNMKSPQEEKAPEIRKKKTHFADKPKSIQSSPREPIDVEKCIKEKVMKEKEAENKRPMERERYVKRTKMKAKSPTQSKSIDGNHGYRMQHYGREGIGPSMKLHLNIPTSDDSSEQYRKDGEFYRYVGVCSPTYIFSIKLIIKFIVFTGTSNGNISPRKHRRLRDSPRRKTGNNSSLAKSPTTGNNHSYR